MTVCGVEIKSKEAILALVQNGPEECLHIQCATKKLTLLDDREKKSLLSMKSAIEAFALSNSVEKFIIKSRQFSGQRAGGGLTFKIETLFQLSPTPVIFVSPPTLAKFAKGNRGGVPGSVFAYQTDAYRAAAWFLSK